MTLFHKYTLDFFKKPTWTDESLQKVFLNNLNEYYNIGEIRSDELIDRDEIWNGGGRGNNHGFRDANFDKCADILAAGCSFTWGAGLYEQHRWPNHIKNLTNQSLHNIGVSGGSVYGTTSRIYAYIRKFGKPKTILCLFPDFFRIYLPLIPDRLIHPRVPEDNLIKDIDGNKQPALIDYGWYNWDEGKLEYTQPHYSKIPHMVHDVLPAELMFYMAMQEIHRFEQYCEGAGINLVWGTWHYETFLFIEKIKSLADSSYFKSFVNISPASQYTKRSGLDEFPDFQCHQSLKEEDQLTYWMAADGDHWGSHSQIHIAEIFYEKIKEYL